LDCEKTMHESNLGIYLATVLSVGVGIAGWVLLKVVAIESRLASFTQWLQDHEKLDLHNFDGLADRLEGIDRDMRELKEKIYKVDQSSSNRQNQILSALSVMSRKLPIREEHD